MPIQAEQAFAGEGGRHPARLDPAAFRRQAEARAPAVRGGGEGGDRAARQRSDRQRRSQIRARIHRWQRLAAHPDTGFVVADQLVVGSHRPTLIPGRGPTAVAFLTAYSFG
ncbi:hypothetical protein GCM10010198_58590 [Nocardia seriolae]